MGARAWAHAHGPTRKLGTGDWGPRTLRRSGSLLLLPPVEAADAGHAAAAAPWAAAAAHTLCGTTAAAQRAAAAARAVGGTAAATAGVAAAADPIGAAVTAGTLGCKLSDRYARRHREGLCCCNRCRGDRRGRRSRHDQRSDEFQFRHHDSGLPPRSQA